MKDKFFSYHWDDGFETHKTESEAKERCEELLSLDLQDAYEGIPDEIQDIFWEEFVSKQTYSKRTIKSNLKARWLTLTM